MRRAVAVLFNVRMKDKCCECNTEQEWRRDAWFETLDEAIKFADRTGKAGFAQRSDCKKCGAKDVLKAPSRIWVVADGDDDTSLYVAELSPIKIRAPTRAMINHFNSPEYHATLLARAESGDTAAMASLAGTFCMMGTQYYDAKKALYWATRGAEGGNADAMYSLGNTLAHTDGAAAVVWLKRAASLGIHQPMFMLAYMYEHGQGGVALDKALAEEWELRGRKCPTYTGRDKIETPTDPAHHEPRSASRVVTRGAAF